MEPSFFQRVYLVVKQIPRGQVASYGQIAALLGHPHAARTVGWALSALSEAQAAEVPWQRVINSQGRISLSRVDMGADIQRSLLEEEGIEFDERGYVDLARYGWQGMDWYEVEALCGQGAIAAPLHNRPNYCNLAAFWQERTICVK